MLGAPPVCLLEPEGLSPHIRRPVPVGRHPQDEVGVHTLTSSALWQCQGDPRELQQYYLPATEDNLKHIHHMLEIL